MDRVVGLVGRCKGKGTCFCVVWAVRHSPGDATVWLCNGCGWFKMTLCGVTGDDVVVESLLVITRTAHRQTESEYLDKIWDLLSVCSRQDMYTQNSPVNWHIVHCQYKLSSTHCTHSHLHTVSLHSYINHHHQQQQQQHQQCQLITAVI